MLKKLSKSNKRILLVFVFIFGFISIYLIGSFVGLWLFAPLNGGGGDPPTMYASLPGTPTLNVIQPNPDTDDTITLDWSDSLRLWHYNVWRKVSGGSWDIIKIALTSSFFI
ncbi:hypothetical protein LCGC14_1093460, partial [marine sediment metagenome]